MVKSVYKYTLPNEDISAIRMSRGASIIHAHNQDDNICLWALVDANEERTEERIFRVAGTGHLMNSKKMKYIGTVHLYSGALVFHVFEVFQ
jgi:hypothetical protein